MAADAATEVLTLYWTRRDDGLYQGALPDGTVVVRTTQPGLLACLACAARRSWDGPLRLADRG